MNEKQFIATYCHNCGTQRCEGIGTEWFEGCRYKWSLDGMEIESTAEINRLKEQNLVLATKIVRLQKQISKEEVKHGEWIGVVDYGNGNCIGYCSVCGTTRNAESATHLKAFNKHCGWCGAKMDGGKTE